MDQLKLLRADALEATARRLRKEAYEERPLPDFWRVGQEVRFIRDMEWAWAKGEIGVIVAVESPDLPARKYQVFFTGRPGQPERYYTTPEDVELVEETPRPDDTMEGDLDSWDGL